MREVTVTRATQQNSMLCVGGRADTKLCATTCRRAFRWTTWPWCEEIILDRRRSVVVVVSDEVGRTRSGERLSGIVSVDVEPVVVDDEVRIVFWVVARNVSANENTS